MTSTVVGGVITTVFHPLFTGTYGLDQRLLAEHHRRSGHHHGLGRLQEVHSRGQLVAGPRTPMALTSPQALWRRPGNVSTAGPRARAGPAPGPSIPGFVRLLGTTMAGNALTEMQTAAFEEGLGVVYMRADGTLTFRQRDAAISDPRQVTVQATFSDRDDDPAGACYSDIVPEGRRDAGLQLRADRHQEPAHANGHRS